MTLFVRITWKGIIAANLRKNLPSVDIDSADVDWFCRELADTVEAAIDRERAKRATVSFWLTTILSVVASLITVGIIHLIF